MSLTHKPEINTGLIKCSYCGLLHPPLKSGEICPVVNTEKVKIQQLSFQEKIIGEWTETLIKMIGDEKDITKVKRLLVELTLCAKNFLKP